MSDTTKIPVWFWIIAVVALLWNAMGLWAFLDINVLMTPEKLGAMPEKEQAVLAATPSWARVAFGVAVICGVLGSIGLLIKQDWAAPVFAISLLGLIVQMIYVFGMSNSMEVYGAGAAAMPGMIFVVCVFLIWFAHSCTKKGWLT